MSAALQADTIERIAPELSPLIHGCVVDHETKDILWNCDHRHRVRARALECALRQRDHWPPAGELARLRVKYPDEPRLWSVEE